MPAFDNVTIKALPAVLQGPQITRSRPVVQSQRGNTLPYDIEAEVVRLNAMLAWTPHSQFTRFPSIRRVSILPLIALVLGGSLIAEAEPSADADSGNQVPGINATATAAALEADSSGGPSGFFQIVFSGGWTGFLIVLLLALLSITGLALAVEHVMTIRQDILIPPGLGEAVARSLSSGDLRAADLACQQKPSVLAFVLRAGLAEVDGGWPAVEKSTEDALAEQAARLLRRVEYLSVLGNIAPMVGLLGTVIGMIFAFQEVADTQGAARAAELASGIYQALVTTVGGLLVAIPSLAAYAIFRNRVDQLIAEAAYTAQHALLPIKRARTARRGPPAPPRGGPAQ